MEQNNNQFENYNSEQNNNQIEQMNKKRKRLLIIGPLILLVALIGVTYAFFNYTRTGLANTIRTGQIAFNSVQGNAINLINVFPIDVSNGIPDDNTIVGSVTINITGNTTYEQGVEYLISVVNVTNTINNKKIPISIDVSYSENGNGKVIGSEEDNYFTIRGDDTSMYKILANETIINDDDIMVGYIAPGITGIDGNIVIKAYLDDKKIAISDTYSPGAEPTYHLNPNLSENDINSCVQYLIDNEYDYYYGDGETMTTFCNGTGKLDDMYFDEWIESEYFYSNDIDYFISNNIMIQSDIDGTTYEWVNHRTVFTTEEWNLLQQSGLSFEVRVEANEGIWVNEPISIYENIKRNADTVTQIDFGQNSSSSNGEGIYVLAGTSNDTYPIYYYRGNINNNNVIFGGFCWQIVRTTNTGGVKMIYNGAPTGNGKTCEKSNSSDRALSGYTRFNSTSYISNQVLKQMGYMYNKEYARYNATPGQYSYFGTEVEYGDFDNNGTSEYKLVSPSTTVTADRHYTCDLNNLNTCTTVRYYYRNNDYINLEGGETIEDALYKITGNATNEVKSRPINQGYELNVRDSDIKIKIENWFKEYLTDEMSGSNIDYRKYLEDTEFCNDRSYKTVVGNTEYSTYEESGWNPNGGLRSNSLSFGANNRWKNNGWYSISNVPSMTCPNETDRFKVSNPKAKLNYPVGLLTLDEVILAGISGNETVSNESYYLKIDNAQWTITPSSWSSGSVYFHSIYGGSGSIGGSLESNYLYVRPVISLKSEIKFEKTGNGTPTNPYIVKYN